MSLRLLMESSTDNKKLHEYITEEFFNEAKKNLAKDEKTTISSKIEDEKKLIKLLQIGAHQYSVSASVEDLIAISLIIGKMLIISHGKK